MQQTLEVGFVALTDKGAQPPGLRQIRQQLGIRDQVEVGFEIFPLNPADAGNRRAQGFTAHAQGQFVTNIEAELIRHPMLYRKLGSRTVGVEPFPGNNFILIGNFPSMGNIESVLGHMMRTRVHEIDASDIDRVDLRQPCARQRIRRGSVDLVLLHKGADGFDIVAANIDQEVVGYILGQLLLPGAQQFVLDHRD